MSRVESVEAYLEGLDRFRDELAALRAPVLESGLQETIKWGAPCYVWNGSNVVGLGGFKDYFGLWFFQGALLRDPAKVLVNVADARREDTRQRRIEKVLPLIRAGVGLNDRYRRR